MTIWDRQQSIISLISSVVISGLVALLIWELPVSRFHVLWALVGATGFYYLSMRRYIKRKRLVQVPFPQAWREILSEYVRYYNELDPKQKARFEQYVLIFLGENRITGIDTEVTDEVKLLVASSAIMLIFGRPGWEYQNIPEILIYPGNFDENFDTTCPHSRRVLAGMVVPQSGLILSKPELYRSFRYRDAYHVGLHEFAHLMDMEAWHTDGIPRDMDPRMLRPWSALMERELDRVRRNKSILREYAGTSASELFAVAVEYFFQAPSLLREHHPELYEMLAAFLNQDLDRSRIM
jgi:Mlc titration factor MtfA (ptsG expression regulator)